MVVKMSVKRQAVREECIHNRSTSSASLEAGSRRFKGVRRRSWGRWVSEIRLPNSRDRLWLGSFATAEQAARAFDVAIVCLRGRSASLNFPDSPPSHAPVGLSHHEIVELAAAAAATYHSSAIPETTFQPELTQYKNPSSVADSEKPKESSMCYEQKPSSSISSDLTSDSESMPHISTESLDAVAIDSSCSAEQVDSMEDFLQVAESDESEVTTSNRSFPLSLQYLEEDQFDKPLWSFFSSSPYSSLDQQLSMPPPPPHPEDEFSTTVEPCLWEFSTEFLSSSILCC